MSKNYAIAGRNIPSPRLVKESEGNWTCTAHFITRGAAEPELAYLRWLQVYAAVANIPERVVAALTVTVARAFRNRVERSRR
jgi:hypothetical protein